MNAQELSEFQYAKLNDPTVYRMVEHGAPLEAIIGQLVRDKEAYLKHIVSLERIAPRKIKLPDGRVLVWTCPEDSIPMR